MSETGTRSQQKAVRLDDGRCLTGEDGERRLVSWVSKSHPDTRCQSQDLNVLLGDVEGDGHREQSALTLTIESFKSESVTDAEVVGFVLSAALQLNRVVAACEPLLHTNRSKQVDVKSWTGRERGRHHRTTFVIIAKPASNSPLSCSSGLCYE